MNPDLYQKPSSIRGKRSPYVTHLSRDEWKEEMRDEIKDWTAWKCWFPFFVIGFFIGTVLVVVALGLSISAFQSQNRIEKACSYTASGFLNTGCRLHKLEAAGINLQIRLLGDLSSYVNQRHTIVSTTNKAHTVVIEAGLASWDKPANSKTATFGGAENDGFSFRVIGPTQIYVEDNNNVAFS